MFMDIEVFLQDAEHRRFTNHSEKEWLNDLEDLAYDAEDILESFKVEVLHREIITEQDGASSSLFGNLISKATNFKDKLPILSSEFKYITNKLKILTERKTKLDLFSRNLFVSYPSSITDRDPGSFLPEHGMYGKETERQMIIEFLLNQETRVEVIAIVGMGGLGKTTLAQSIYNDNTIVEHFKSRAWVYVSKSFDVKRIIKAIFESVTLQPCQYDNLDVIKVHINEILKEKTFLLVLDDVWNISILEWDDLIAMLCFKGKGSKVVVTTRNADVAANVQSCGDYLRLGALSDEHCWNLFCYNCGFSSTRTLNTEFEKIGREVVGKCSGLPLAVRSISRLLRCKKTKEEWETILRDVIATSDETEDELMAILRTSYYDLPSDLKRCFLSCVLFPESFPLLEDRLVPIWIGLGIIPDEEKGHYYFQQLVSRSMLSPYVRNVYSDQPAHLQVNLLLFQTGSISDATLYVMHDLIREMGQEISGNLYFNIPSEQPKFFGCSES